MTNAAPVVSLDSFLPQLKLDALCVVLRHSIHQAAEAGENAKAAAEAAAEAFAAGLAAFEKARGGEAAPVDGCSGPAAEAMQPPAAPRAPESREIPLRDEEWRIEIKGDSFLFRRYVGGRIDETYRSVNRDMANVFAVAVIQGFEPPVRLRWSDRPVARG